jgi:isopentenyl diphosphate isomerase/L-lactate dehydrogenase-like FMN-dependent dehydrogenase
MPHSDQANTRRQFLRLLAASPVLPWLQLSPTLQAALAQEVDPIGLSPATLKSLEDYGNDVASAKEAVDIFDLERTAQRKLHVGHNAYLSASEDQATLRANRDGFKRYELRPRRLVDVSKIDMSITLFGTRWDTPLILCPVGHQGAFHPEGEVAVARAAKARKHIQTLSTVATRSIEDVVAARGGPVWHQLYRSPDWNLTRAMIKRAEAAGSPVMAFTVDGQGGAKRGIASKIRSRHADLCRTCHTLDPKWEIGGDADTGGFLGADPPMKMTPSLGPPLVEKGSPTWDYVKRLKDTTSMKVLIKGISTREDAELAMEHGADGVWLSNHGGRIENSGRSTVECIPEMVAGVAKRGPVIVDSGFRRGGDIFKALALGATAVGIGRPYIWGLASFGQEGVEAALDILDTELRMVMRQMGVTNLDGITRNYLVDRARY